MLITFCWVNCSFCTTRHHKYCNTSYYCAQSVNQENVWRGLTFTATLMKLATSMHEFPKCMYRRSAFYLLVWHRNSFETNVQQLILYTLNAVQWLQTFVTKYTVITAMETLSRQDSMLWEAWLMYELNLRCGLAKRNGKSKTVCKNTSTSSLGRALKLLNYSMR